MPLMNKKILWAVKLGEEDWREEIITITKSLQHLQDAKFWAEKNGFDPNSFRLSDYDEFPTKPDFSNPSLLNFKK